MHPAIRKFVLGVHLTCSLGWIGSILGYLVLGASAVTSTDPQTVRAAWIAMELTGWFAIVPLAIGALVTGLVLSLGTPWGLFRHYWVLFSLALTVFSTVILLLHMPTVSGLADVARSADGPALHALGGDLFHPTAGLLVLVSITILNVYKPRGLTLYGWRVQQAEQGARQAKGLLPADEEPSHGT
jgi:hypothetical protein